MQLAMSLRNLKYLVDGIQKGRWAMYLSSVALMYIIQNSSIRAYLAFLPRPSLCPQQSKGGLPSSRSLGRGGRQTATSTTRAERGEGGGTVGGDVDVDGS